MSTQYYRKNNQIMSVQHFKGQEPPNDYGIITSTFKSINMAKKYNRTQLGGKAEVVESFPAIPHGIQPEQSDMTKYTGEV